MPSKKIFHLFFSFLLCLWLTGCADTPEPLQVCAPGCCTPAMKKATSRPYKIKGVWYHPQPHYEYNEVGIASYYGGGDVFHGRPTATGKIFDMNGITAAHKTVPLPCIAQVTNLDNGRQINVEINDRGPFVEGRIIDVSRRVAQLLGFERKGTARVRVQTLVPQSLALNNQSPLLTSPKVMLASKSSVRPTTTVTVKKKSVNKVILAKASPPPSLKRGIFVDVQGCASQEEAKKISKRLAHVASSSLCPIQNKGPKPYGVRMGPFASMSNANSILDQLMEAGHHSSRIIILR